MTGAVVMLAEAMAVMAVLERVLGVGDVGDEEDGWRSKNTPSTSWGGCSRSTEGSPAWNIAGPDGVAPVGAEDGCKKVCKGFHNRLGFPNRFPPTPGAKF